MIDENESLRREVTKLSEEIHDLERSIIESRRKSYLLLMIPSVALITLMLVTFIFGL